MIERYENERRGWRVLKWAAEIDGFSARIHVTEGIGACGVPLYTVHWFRVIQGARVLGGKIRFEILEAAKEFAEEKWSDLISWMGDRECLQ